MGGSLGGLALIGIAALVVYSQGNEEQSPET
jgi:hypothetical protein